MLNQRNIDINQQKQVIFTDTSRWHDFHDLGISTIISIKSINGYIGLSSYPKETYQ